MAKIPNTKMRYSTEEEAEKAINWLGLFCLGQIGLTIFSFIVAYIYFKYIN